VSYLLQIRLEPPLFFVRLLRVRQATPALRAEVPVHDVLDRGEDHVEGGVRVRHQLRVFVTREASQEGAAQPIGGRFTQRADAGRLGDDAPRQGALGVGAGFGGEGAMLRQEVAHVVHVTSSTFGVVLPWNRSHQEDFDVTEVGVFHVVDPLFQNR
jgi:hypothetical protein